MNTAKLGDRYDLSELHDKVLQSARERERMSVVDMLSISRIASDAFRQSKREGTDLADAQERALAALEKSEGDSERMFDDALRALKDEEVASQVRKREFAYEFLFAAAVPALATTVVVWLAMWHSEFAAKSVFAVVSAAFLAATVFALMGAVKGSRVARLNSWNAVLVHSGGSLLAGLCVLLVSGYVAHGFGERQFSQEREARLDKVNQAAAVTLAAIQVNASVEKTQAAVLKSTSADWIHVEDTPRSEGSVLVRATLARAQLAELRLASSSDAAPRLATFLTNKSGVLVPYVDYVTGTVVSADLNKVTLSTGPLRTEKVYSLPPGTLPPPVKSDVVAAISRADQSVVFIQSIDAVVAELKR